MDPFRISLVIATTALLLQGCAAWKPIQIGTAVYTQRVACGSEQSVIWRADDHMGDPRPCSVTVTQQADSSCQARVKGFGPGGQVLPFPGGPGTTILGGVTSVAVECGGTPNPSHHCEFSITDIDGTVAGDTRKKTVISPGAAIFQEQRFKCGDPKRTVWEKGAEATHCNVSLESHVPQGCYGAFTIWRGARSQEFRTGGMFGSNDMFRTFLEMTRIEFQCVPIAAGPAHGVCTVRVRMVECKE